jgi:glycosyltransferase involved in cell wall biosynthesis
LPLSVFEAAASGVSVVSSAVSDLPKLLDGAVRFVPPGDIDALREVAVALLRSPADRSRLGARARDLVRPRFDVSSAAAAYVEVYLRS